jgi:hypothetical protein
MTLETLPPDPALPSLRIAGDRNRMREFFRRHLRPLPGSDWELEDCRLSRTTTTGATAARCGTRCA